MLLQGTDFATRKHAVQSTGRWIEGVAMLGMGKMGDGWGCVIEGCLREDDDGRSGDVVGNGNRNENGNGRRINVLGVRSKRGDNGPTPIPTATTSTTTTATNEPLTATDSINTTAGFQQPVNVLTGKKKRKKTDSVGGSVDLGTNIIPNGQDIRASTIVVPGTSSSEAGSGDVNVLRAGLVRR